MANKSERIAELEKEVAAHDMQCNSPHEGDAALQKTIAALRREVVIRTQETRDLQNSKYLLWKKHNALQTTVKNLVRAKNNALDAAGIPTVIKYVHSLEGRVEQLEKWLVEAREDVASLELYNNQLEYRNWLLTLLKAAANPLSVEWRGYLAGQLANKWESKGFAEHVRREATLRTRNFSKPKF